MRSFLSLLLLFATPYLMAEEVDQLGVLSQDFGMNDLGTRPSTAMRGQLRPVNHTVLSAGLDGKLISFPIKSGVTVKKGQTIARFLCEQEEAAHMAAVAKRDQAAKNHEINQKLDEFKNVSELDISISAAEVEITQAEVKRTRAILGECRLVAPFDATVTEKFVQTFQYVEKGTQLLELVDTHTLEVEMVLPSLDVRQYVRNTEFTLVLDETGQRVTARVDRVVNVIDPVSQTVRVIGRIAGNPQGLMPGMSGVVSFSP